MKVSRGKHEPGCRETQQTPFEWTAWPEMAPFWDPWLRPYGTSCAMARVEMAVRACAFHNGFRAGPTKRGARARPRVRADRFLLGFGELLLVAHCRALPKAPSILRAIFFYFLSSAHRAPSETRERPVETVLRGPTRTSGHHFPGSHSKIHVGKEMWYAIAPLRPMISHDERPEPRWASSPCGLAGAEFSASTAARAAT